MQFEDSQRRTLEQGNYVNDTISGMNKDPERVLTTDLGTSSRSAIRQFYPQLTSPRPTRVIDHRGTAESTWGPWTSTLNGI